MSSISNLGITPLNRGKGLREKVTESVMLSVFSGKICAGDRLIVMKIAQQLGVSASPVREALVELASVGLVELLPNRGAICLPFGERQLREIFALRRLLEVEATRLAHNRLPLLELEEIKRRSQELQASKGSSSTWSALAMEVDTALHDLLFRCSDNQRLGLEIDRYHNMMSCLRQVAGNQKDVQSRAIEEHLAIICSLEEKSPTAATERMAEHIDATAERLAQLLFQGKNSRKKKI